MATPAVERRHPFFRNAAVRDVGRSGHRPRLPRPRMGMAESRYDHGCSAPYRLGLCGLLPTSLGVGAGHRDRRRDWVLRGDGSQPSAVDRSARQPAPATAEHCHGAGRDRIAADRDHVVSARESACVDRLATGIGGAWPGLRTQCEQFARSAGAGVPTRLPRPDYTAFASEHDPHDDTHWPPNS